MPLWLYWVLLGLLAGSLAKFLVPGRDPSGCIVTVVLGIAGAFIGGLLASALGAPRVVGLHIAGFSGNPHETRFPRRNVALQFRPALAALKTRSGR